MNENRSYSYEYVDADRKSAQQLDVLEKSFEDATFNDDQLSKLITRTSDLDQLTAHTIHKNYKYNAVWIIFAVIAAVAILCFL